MSQYRVKADQVLHQHVYTNQRESELELPAALVSLLQRQTNLFEKYMPHYCPTTPVQKRVVSYQRVSYSVFYDAAAAASAECGEDGDDEKQAPTAQNTILLPSVCDGGPAIRTRSRVTMSNGAFLGVYYAFLMVHARKGKKKDTNVGVSQNPIFAVIAHNNQAYVPRGTDAVKGGATNRRHETRLDNRIFPVIYDKDTASAAPHWKLDMAIGPMTNAEAIETCHNWVVKTRGTDSKRKRGIELAHEKHRNLYSSQIPINRPLEQHLLHLNAPIEYIQAARTLRNTSDQLVQQALERGDLCESRPKSNGSHNSSVHRKSGTGSLQKKRRRPSRSNSRPSTNTAPPVIEKRTSNSAPTQSHKSHTKKR